MAEPATPSYRMITEEIVRRIHEGYYPPRSFLPSENQLAREFKVTRTTIRKVLDILKHQGTVESFQGKGYQVRPLYWEQSLLQFYSFGRSVAGQLDNARTEVVSVQVIDGLEDVREFSGVELWEITRLRTIDEIPLILETSYVPKELLPNLDPDRLQAESLYDLLDEEKVHVVKAKEHLQPVLPPAEVWKLMKLSCDQPLFQTLRYSYDSNGQLVEFRGSLIRGDRFGFYTEMTL